MKIKFGNYSVSGIYREYAGFTLNIPGHAIGNKAVVTDVPDDLVSDVKKYLASNHPAVVITEGEGLVGPVQQEQAAKEAADKAEADRLAAEAEATQKAADEAAALAAREQEEADNATAEAAKSAAAAKEAADKAEVKAKKGGK